jgi:hypothetical protein
VLCVVHVFNLKRPLGRPRPRWKYNITMNLREMVWRVWSGFVRVGLGSETSVGMLRTN